MLTCRKVRRVTLLGWKACGMHDQRHETATYLEIDVNSTLHIYAHCHPANNGSVSLAFVNIGNGTEYRLVDTYLWIAIGRCLVADASGRLSVAQPASPGI